MNRATHFALCGFLLALAGGTASADTLTGSCTQVGPQKPDITTSITCTQFDLTGLESISLTINGEIVGTISITNNDDTPENVNATVDSTWSVSSPLSGFSFPAPLYILTFGTGAVTIPAMTSETFPSTGQFSSTNTDTQVDSNSSTFAPYIGAGSFSIPVVTDTTLSLSEGVGCSPCSIGSSTAASLTETAAVVYTYLPITTGVPEPTTAMLLAAGVVFLILGSRRNRKLA
jgi:hypothetical protein